jgi:holo-[acyl-carrier protein] synthase
MSRIYQGVDLVDIPKFQEVFNRNRDFITDIFTKGERDYCLSKKEPHVHFAGRFAAKEACMKALGMGLSGIDNLFQEIEVSSNASGRPLLSLNGWAEKMTRKRRIDQLTVSISHSGNYAVATVVLVGN